MHSHYTNNKWFLQNYSINYFASDFYKIIQFIYHFAFDFDGVSLIEFLANNLTELPLPVWLRKSNNKWKGLWSSTKMYFLRLCVRFWIYIINLERVF